MWTVWRFQPKRVGSPVSFLKAGLGPLFCWEQVRPQGEELLPMVRAIGLLGRKWGRCKFESDEGKTGIGGVSLTIELTFVVGLECLLMS
jgi:hypothetical protein